MTAATTEDGSYSEVDNFVIGAGTIAAGTQFYTYTPNSTVAHYVKVAITTLEDLSSDTVTATIHHSA